jgi:hypothetical protein
MFTAETKLQQKVCLQHKQQKNSKEQKKKKINA